MASNSRFIASGAWSVAGAAYRDTAQCSLVTILRSCGGSGCARRYGSDTRDDRMLGGPSLGTPARFYFSLALLLPGMWD